MHCANIPDFEKGGGGGGQRISGYATSPGVAREHNEDSLCIRPGLGLWAVADGMGGYQAGELASRITVEQLAEDIYHYIPLAKSIYRIHDKILSAARTDSAYESMGSTVVALKVDGSNYEIAWVGDSRAYLWDGRQLTRLTRDHSYVQSLVDAGTITAAEAEIHPERHAIIQALGADSIDSVEVETINGTFQENDKILLCSDGLSNELADEEIASILSQTGSEQSVAEQLIAAAEKNGGRDNISAILVGPDPAPSVETIDENANLPQANSVAIEGRIHGLQFWLWMVLAFFALVFAVIVVYDLI
jgi:protein phosphatase